MGVRPVLGLDGSRRLPSLAARHERLVIFWISSPAAAPSASNIHTRDGSVPEAFDSTQVHLVESSCVRFLSLSLFLSFAVSIHETEHAEGDRLLAAEGLQGQSATVVVIRGDTENFFRCSIAQR